MSKKPLLVLQSPVATRSGYGSHARDILKSLYDMDKFEIKLLPTAWGTTPQNQLDPSTEFGKRAIGDITNQLTQQPDVFIQLTVANEFNPVGKFNIGITAGVETTFAPQDTIEGCNRMDLIITPSEFTKKTIATTVFNKINRKTKQVIGEVKLQKPVEVLMEGIDLSIYNGKSKDTTILDDIKEDFCFLMVGHWLSGKIGEDRKDVGMLIKTFCSTFKNTSKEKRPALILKTSAAGFSIGDRDIIYNKIKQITDEFGSDCPPVYLLFGDLPESDLNELYNHPKVKSMVMFTRGEGYGRPLAEFATTGKPIIVSHWSGHTDFLPEANTVYLPGKLTQIDPTAVNKFLIKESQWFTVDYSIAARQLHNVYKQYDDFHKQSRGLRSNINKNFSLKKMTEKFSEILDAYKVVPKRVELKLPEIHKL